LGGFYRQPSARIIDGAMRLKEKGFVRFIGISSHKRRLFPGLREDGVFDIFHLRYNAVHRGAETEVFPSLPLENGPGIVSFTATNWGKLLYSSKIPSGEKLPAAGDCYRFVLSHPAVHVCMTGPRTVEEMRQNLAVLEQCPMTDEELTRMRRIGDHVYGRKRN
jgi:predicted aldo/keto reductase-like oxidoreductase